MKKKIVIIGLVSLFILGAKITSDTLRIGNNISEDITIIFDTGVATPPIIAWDNAAGKIQFSHDGVNYFGLGEDPGTVGINLLANPGFESGATSWTSSGGSLSITSSGAEVGVGGKSAKWDASATLQTFKSDLKTVENILEGRPCLASINYLWDAGTLTHLRARVENSVAGVVASNVDLPVTAGGVWGVLDLAFTCPATESLTLIIESTANAAEITLDQMHLGQDIRAEIPNPLNIITAVYPNDNAIGAGTITLNVTNNSRFTMGNQTTTINNFSGGVDGQVINLVLTSSGSNLTLVNGNATGGNQMLLTGGTRNYVGYRTITFIYHASSLTWFLESDVGSNSITALDIAPNAVGNAEMADNAIGNVELATNAVSNLKMADNAIGTNEIQDATVTSPKILVNTVGVCGVGNICSGVETGSTAGACLVQCNSCNRTNTNWVKVGNVVTISFRTSLDASSPSPGYQCNVSLPAGATSTFTSDFMGHGTCLASGTIPDEIATIRAEAFNDDLTISWDPADAGDLTQTLECIAQYRIEP